MAGGLNYKGLNAKKASAVGVALITLLQNDDVRKALGGAGAGLTAWSKRTRARFDAPLSDHTAKATLAAPHRRPRGGDPRFRDARCRIRGRAADGRGGASAGRVRGRQMPVSKRVPAQRSIARRLDKLEHALIDAVL